MLPPNNIYSHELEVSFPIACHSSVCSNRWETAAQATRGTFSCWRAQKQLVMAPGLRPLYDKPRLKQWKWSSLPTSLMFSGSDPFSLILCDGMYHPVLSFFCHICSFCQENSVNAWIWYQASRTQASNWLGYGHHTHLRESQALPPAPHNSSCVIFSTALTLNCINSS